jgi:hypothetical protein
VESSVHKMGGRSLLRGPLQKWNNSIKKDKESLNNKDMKSIIKRLLIALTFLFVKIISRKKV